MKQFFLSFLCFFLAVFTQAQSITLIPNLNSLDNLYVPITEYHSNLYFGYSVGNAGSRNVGRYDGQSLNLVSANGVQIYGYTGPAIVFNDRLYFSYGSAVSQLASYSDVDSSLILYPNPDSGRIESSVPFVEFNGALYFYFRNTANRIMLAKFDGTQVTLFSNPDTGTGIGMQMVIYNGNLYMGYLNQSSKWQLAKCDGTSLTLISNPDAGTLTATFATAKGYFTLYNNKLCIVYTNASQKRVLVAYDGSSYTVVANPDSGNGITGTPVVYKDTLWVNYNNAQSKYQLACVDSTTITPVTPAVSNNFGFNNHIIYKNKLYFQYDSTNTSIRRLGVFDGQQMSVVANINPTDYGYYGNPFIYKDTLYFSYQSSFIAYQLAKYDQTTLSLLPHPAGAFSYTSVPSFVYKGELYFGYMNNMARTSLAKFANQDSVSVPLAVSNTFKTSSISAALQPIYPNPVVNKTFQVASDVVEVRLYSLSGTSVLVKNTNGNKTINVHMLKSGIYMYQLRNAQGTVQAGKLLIN